MADDIFGWSVAGGIVVGSILWVQAVLHCIYTPASSTKGSA